MFYFIFNFIIYSYLSLFILIYLLFILIYHYLWLFIMISYLFSDLFYCLLLINDLFHLFFFKYLMYICFYISLLKLLLDIIIFWAAWLPPPGSLETSWAGSRRNGGADSCAQNGCLEASGGRLMRRCRRSRWARNLREDPPRRTHETRRTWAHWSKINWSKIKNFKIKNQNPNSESPIQIFFRCQKIVFVQQWENWAERPRRGFSRTLPCSTYIFHM